MSKFLTSDNTGPLKGLKVVDLTRFAAGPCCTAILADMGAEVIKIEDLDGDPMRATIPGSIPFYNRNKKSITLNLKADEGKDILRRLIQRGDVLAENFRPGVMKRLGFDYPAVREINPRVVMVSLSAYGQTGPYSQRAGLDTTGQAMGGLMSETKPTPDSPPMSAGGPMADVSTGLFGALGTMMALYHRQSTGLGQHVEADLMESIVFFLGSTLTRHLYGQPLERGARRGPSGTFRAKDDVYIIIMAQDNHWPLMVGIVGRQDLVTAPGYSNLAERAEHGEEIHGLVEAWIGSHTGDEVEAALDKAGIPFGRVQTLAEVLKDPSLKAREMFTEIDYEGKVLQLFGPYPKLSDTPGSIRIPPPTVGQHNEEVYCGLLGFSSKELATLKSKGVV